MRPRRFEISNLKSQIPRPAVTPKSLALLFPVVLVFYLMVFYGIEHLRHRKGPWEVDFQETDDGTPTLVVSQPALGLSRMKILFHHENAGNAAGHVAFDRVLQPVPFGKVIYEDLTFLPGVVTFDLFGHEIELLPRVLIANKREIPWCSGMVLDLWPSNKLPEPLKPPKGNRR